MEMLERCPGCSITREAEPLKVENGLKTTRPCAHCGYDGPFPPPEAAVARSAPHRDSMPSFAGARAKLATATEDLFRLSGHYSIPVEPPAPEPPPPAPEPAVDSSGRKAESSMMFSLEALMKANAPASKPAAQVQEVSEQLWNMQAVTPLFGTAQDQALLTTPLKLEPSPSMDSMTLPSHAPTTRRWWPLAAAVGAGLALAAGGVWLVRMPAAPDPVSVVVPSSEQAALEAQQPPAQLEPVVEPVAAPAPTAQPAVADPVAPAPEQAAPTEAAPTEAAPTEAAPAGEPSATPAPEPPAARVTRPAAPRAARKAPPRAAPSSQKGAAFDKSAARSALNAAAAQAAGCGQGGAPGKGKVQVTFAPSGKVSSASLVGGPFAGTAAGQCALRQFRAARVPAFSGAAVTVAKSFEID